MTQNQRLKNVSIVLHHTRVPENIGAAARAAANMGVGQLIVSAPRNLDMERILKVATHTASGLVKTMTVCDSLAQALEPFTWVVGTTARLGGTRQVNGSPSQVAKRVVPILCENQVAILFGPEDRGLTNEDLHLCHDLVTIPTAEFSSLNLAQAVMVMCYELFNAAGEAVPLHIPKLAGRHELDQMYTALQEMLARIHGINPENPGLQLEKCRRFLSRYQLRSREASIIRSLCRHVKLYGDMRYQDGMAAATCQGADRPADKKKIY